MSEAIKTDLSKQLSIFQKIKKKRKEEEQEAFSKSSKQIDQWIELGEWFEEGSGGPGFPCGHISTLLGKNDSGKTTLMMEGMVSCQEQGGIVYFIDSEHKFDESRFKMMGGNPELIEVLDVTTLEESWDAMTIIVKEARELRAEGFDAPIMVAWDSVAASVPGRIADEKESGKAHIAVEAKINNKNVRKFRQAIRETNICLVVINHFYFTQPSNPMERPELVIKHGEEWGWMSTMILMFKKGKQIKRVFKGKDQKIGRVCRITVEKGHFHGRTQMMEAHVVEHGIVSPEELKEYQTSLKGKR